MKKNSNISYGQFRVSRIALMLAGFVACAAPARNAESRPFAPQAGGYQVEVLVGGVPAQSFWHNGETFVLGQLGDRYTIRVSNHSHRRVEAVVSVDGRDVIDGKPGDYSGKRGYLVPAWGQVEIDGWRLSQREAATFRFSSVADSYAARVGSARNVGVVGVAIFPERIYRPRPIYPAIPYRDDDHRRYESHGSRSANKAAGAPAAQAPSEDMRDGIASEAAPAPSQARQAKGGYGESYAPSRSRPGLGTEFGEAVSSHIREVDFVRANQSVPAVLLGLRYNDRAGLLAMGINVDGYDYPDDSDLRRTADPFPVSHSRYARPPSDWRDY